MKRKLLLLILILVITSISASAQNASDLAAKYGAPHQSYEIRPGIFMTVKSATDGQACELSIEKRHVTGSGTINLDPTILSPEEMKEIVEELAPISARGKERKGSGDMVIIGGGGTTVYDYENCRIAYLNNPMDGKYGGTVAIIIYWWNRGCKR